MHSLVAPTGANHRGSRCTGRIDRQCPFEQRDGLANALFGVLVTQLKRAQIPVAGIEAFGWLAECTLDLGRPESGPDRADDTARDLVLQFEDVVERAIKAVGPDMRAAGSVDQLAYS